MDNEGAEVRKIIYSVSTAIDIQMLRIKTATCVIRSVPISISNLATNLRIIHNDVNSLISQGMY